MRFHWVRDRIKQHQFKVIWRQGAVNIADFLTKPLPIKEFLRLRHFLVRMPPQDRASDKPVGSPSHLSRSQAWRQSHSQPAVVH